MSSSGSRAVISVLPAVAGAACTLDEFLEIFPRTQWLEVRVAPEVREVVKTRRQRSAQQLDRLRGIGL
jgi:hypothetical protein